MTINYTSLLGLAQPVTGTETGLWGDVVNDSITALLEDAVADVASFSVTAGDVTLTTTSGSANQARMAILIATGTPGLTRNVIAPSQSKTYTVINQSNAAIVIKGAATTGVTLPASSVAYVAWNGSDFQVIGTTNAAFFSGTYGTISSVSASGITTRQSANQDGVRLLGRSGGSTDYEVTITPTTLLADRTVTLPDATTTMVGTDVTQTLTNKTIQGRVASLASGPSFSPNADTSDIVITDNTQPAGLLTMNAPTGTPYDGQRLMYRMKTQNIQTFSWNGIYQGSTDLPLPSTSTGSSKFDYMGFVYNSSNGYWQLVAKTFGF